MEQNTEQQVEIWEYVNGYANSVVFKRTFVTREDALFWSNNYNLGFDPYRDLSYKAMLA
jgi:hypothetical protein